MSWDINFLSSLSSFEVTALALILVGVAASSGIFFGIVVLFSLIQVVFDGSLPHGFLFAFLVGGAFFLSIYLTGVVADSLGMPRDYNLDPSSGPGRGIFRLLAGVTAATVVFHPTTISVVLSVYRYVSAPFSQLLFETALQVVYVVTFVTVVLASVMALYELPVSAMFASVRRQLNKSAVVRDVGFDESSLLASVRPLVVLWLMVVLFDPFSSWIYGLFLSGGAGHN